MNYLFYIFRLIINNFLVSIYLCLNSGEIFLRSCACVERCQYCVSVANHHIIVAVVAEHQVYGVKQVLAVKPRCCYLYQKALSYVAAALIACVCSALHRRSQNIRVNHKRKHYLRVCRCRSYQVVGVAISVFQRLNNYSAASVFVNNHQQSGENYQVLVRLLLVYLLK